MKIKVLNILLVAALIVVGCDYNDKYFDGYDDVANPTDVKNIEYTLTDADYATISSNTANRALADAAGVRAELNALGTSKVFTETLPASTYLPAFIAAKWFTADDLSAVKVTYNEGISTPDYVTELDGISIYKVSADDYATVWGEGTTTNFFSPATSARNNIPTILAAAYPDAESGDIVAVDYNESENEPSGAVVAINEELNIFTGTVYVAEVEGWNNVITAGTYAWTGRLSSGNGLLQASAFGHSAGESEAYMISPKVKVTAGLNLTFDATYQYYVEEGGRLSVLISSNLAGFTTDDIEAATWDDITSNFTFVQTNTLTPAGSFNLDSYIGKDIYLAFHYYGNGATGATSTAKIDNIIVKSEATGTGVDVYTAVTGLYTYSGTAWAAYSGNGYMVTKVDYTSMGLSYDNFSSAQPDHYLPTFLNSKFPYAQDGAITIATYKYYASSTTTIRADEYVFTSGIWAKAAITESFTSQFVKSNGKWNFDPSIVLTLKPGRSQPTVALYYQAIVDYVGDQYGTDYYQTNYTNAEYYYGSSAYENNFDFRVSAWRTRNVAGATAYTTYDDTALEALMYERLKEAFIPALKANHADMAPVSGVDVICTINFGIYTGTTISACTHQIQYKVIGAGQFEYVEGSFKAL